MLFRAKTHEGYIFKILMELLKNTIQTACFDIQHTGIFLRMMDNKRQILVNLELHAKNFNVYELQSTTSLKIGIQISQFYAMLKSIKKKDSLMLFIDEAQPSALQFYIHPQDNNRKSHSSIQIQEIQNLIMDVPTTYPHPVIIPSSEYQSTIKDITSINSNIRVELRKLALDVSACKENIVSRRVRFGEIDDTTDLMYDEEFDTDVFSRISKIAALGKNLSVYGNTVAYPGLPLQVQSSVGQLGSISIYIQSKRQEKQRDMSARK